MDKTCFCKLCKCSLYGMRVSTFELHEETQKNIKFMNAKHNSRKMTEFHASKPDIAKELK